MELNGARRCCLAFDPIKKEMRFVRSQITNFFFLEKKKNAIPDKCFRARLWGKGNVEGGGVDVVSKTFHVVSTK